MICVASGVLEVVGRNHKFICPAPWRDGSVILDARELAVPGGVLGKALWGHRRAAVGERRRQVLRRYLWSLRFRVQWVRVQAWGLGFWMIFTLAFTPALTVAWMHYVHCMHTLCRTHGTARTMARQERMGQAPWGPFTCRSRDP